MCTTTICVSAYDYICVLTPLYMCPPTTLYVCSYYYISSVLIPLYVCPHSTKYVSSYCYICVLILLYMWPHTTICSCVLILIFICVLIQRAAADSVGSGDKASQFTTALLRLYHCFTHTNIYLCVRTQRAAATVSDLATKHVFFFQYGPASFVKHQ